MMGAEEACVSVTENVSSRRGVLAAALGGVAALAAQALGRPSSAAAANGEALTVGQTKSGTAPTALATTQNYSAGIYAFGVTDKGINAFPQSATIAAHTKDTYGAAVLGYAESGYVGVVGRSQSGSGVHGFSTAGTGVLAEGVYAITSFGRLYIDRSGVATIAAGQTSVNVSAPGGVTAQTFVLLTPKANLGGRDLWFTTDVPNNRFTIRISSSRTKSTPVSWLLLK